MRIRDWSSDVCSSDLVAPIRRALEEIDAPVIAVSPIVGGKAVKGPTTKLMAELGVPVDNAAIAAHYHGVIDGLLIDTTDAPPSGAFHVGRTDTLMRSEEHTSDLQSPMRISYPVCCFKKKNKHN